MFLSSEYRACLKYSVKYANHHLFVELWALRKYCRFVEVAELEKVCSTFCSSCSDLWSVDFCESLSVEIIAECFCQCLLNFKFGTLLNISQGNRSVV